MCVDKFPNMFMCLGPNSVLGAGVLLPVLKYTVMYAVQATTKMQRERNKSMEVKPEAVHAFDEYIEVSPFVASAMPWDANTRSKLLGLAQTVTDLELGDSPPDRIQRELPFLVQGWQG